MLLRGLPGDGRFVRAMSEQHEQDDPLWWRKKLDEKLTGGATTFRQGSVKELMNAVGST